MWTPFNAVFNAAVLPPPCVVPSRWMLWMLCRTVASLHAILSWLWLIRLWYRALLWVESALKTTGGDSKKKVYISQGSWELMRSWAVTDGECYGKMVPIVNPLLIVRCGLGAPLTGSGQKAYYWGMLGNAFSGKKGQFVSLRYIYNIINKCLGNF